MPPFPSGIPSFSRRAFLRGLTLLALRPGFSAAASPLDLRVLIQDRTDATREILTVLTRNFPDARVGSDIRDLSAQPGGVFVAIGPAALHTALGASLLRPLVSLFTSNEAFTRLIAQAPRSRPRAPITAIFAEASPADQLNLARHLYGKQLLVGVLLSPGTAHLEPDLVSAAHVSGLEISIHMVGANETSPRALARLSGIGALVAIPDRALYTSDTLRAILETGYRRNFGTIGFSPALVSAGALAAAYASIEDIVAHLRHWAEPLAAGRVPKPQYPIFWRVAINDRVANSLNVPIDPAVRTLGNRPERAE